LQMTVSFFIALYLLWNPATESIHFGSWFAPPLAKEATEKDITMIFNTFLDADDSSHTLFVKKITEKGGFSTLTTKEYSSRLYLPFFKDPVVQFSGWSLVGLAIFFLFVITGSSNAVNLTDGLDGLATGTVLLSASAFALIAFISNHLDLSKYLNILYIEGSGEIAIYLAATVGACLGFLWYNGHPAQVFMGDTGSLTLGAILGVTSILLKREILLGIIGGVFVIEAFSVILQVTNCEIKKEFFYALRYTIILNIKDGPKPKWFCVFGLSV
jgi:phospho-N-acetylmuramoyl-pentapeptide-transferase